MFVCDLIIITHGHGYLPCTLIPVKKQYTLKEMFQYRQYSLLCKYKPNDKKQYIKYAISYNMEPYIEWRICETKQLSRNGLSFYERNHLIYYAQRYKNTYLLKTIKRNKRIFRDNNIHHERVKGACKQGDLHTVKPLMKRVNSRDSVVYIPRACDSGNMELIRHFQYRYGHGMAFMDRVWCARYKNEKPQEYLQRLKQNDIYSANGILYGACKCGDLNTVKAIWEKVDNRLNWCRAFVIACNNNHILIAKYILSYYPNVLHDRNCMFQCNHMALETFVSLKHVFLPELHLYRGYWLHCIITSGNVELLKYVYGQHCMTLLDADLHDAFLYGHYNITKYYLDIKQQENKKHTLEELQDLFVIACTYECFDVMDLLLSRMLEYKDMASLIHDGASLLQRVKEKDAFLSLAYLRHQGFNKHQ
jgi:hypothetical protein